MSEPRARRSHAGSQILNPTRPTRRFYTETRVGGRRNDRLERGGLKVRPTSDAVSFAGGPLDRARNAQSGKRIRHSFAPASTLQRVVDVVGRFRSDGILPTLCSFCCHLLVYFRVLTVHDACERRDCAPLANHSAQRLVAHELKVELP